MVNSWSGHRFHPPVPWIKSFTTNTCMFHDLQCSTCSTFHKTVTVHFVSQRILNKKIEFIPICWWDHEMCQRLSSTFSTFKKISTDCTRYIEAASIADSFQFFRFEFDWLVSGSSGDPIGRNWSWLKMNFLFISSSASRAVRWSIQLQLNENWRGPKLMYCGRWENFWSSWIRRHLIQSMANVFTLDYCSNIRTGSCQHGHTPNWTA